MAGKRKRPVVTENFAGNLDSIQEFLKREGDLAFRRLLSRLFRQIIPTLCRFPEAGRPLFRHPVHSLEAARLKRRLERMLGPGEQIREFIIGDYLILYLIRKQEAAFLSIKHHRQLSYDLDRFWKTSDR